MYYEFNNFRSVYLEKDEINYFFHELPKITRELIQSSKDETKKSLFESFSEQINLTYNENNDLWIRKFVLFNISLVYRNKHKIITTHPMRFECFK